MPAILSIEDYPTRKGGERKYIKVFCYLEIETKHLKCSLGSNIPLVHLDKHFSFVIDTPKVRTPSFFPNF